MNLHQTQYLNSFRQHLPSFEEKAKSSIYNFESFLSLNDPPNITTLDLDSLSVSSFLNANPTFLGLIQMLRNWNKKVDEYNKEKGYILKKEHYKIQIMSNIHSQLMILLREVNVTEDKFLQNQMLTKIENWFFRETGKKKMIPTFANENIVYMGDIKNNDGAHTGLMKPIYDNFMMESNEKLSGYTRRVPSNDPNNLNLTPNTKSQQNTIKFSNLFDKDIGSKEDQSNKLQKEFRKSILCSHSNTKINPLMFSEAKMENLWLKQRNKEIRAQREDQEIVNFMKEWSKNKGRLQEEINRRGEGNQFGSEFNNLKSDPKNEITLDFEDEDLILKEYPLADNPENEYTKFDNGFNMKNVRVLNEPEEIKGGTEIYKNNNKEDYVADFFKDEANLIKAKEEKGEKVNASDNMKYSTPSKPVKTNNNNKSNKNNNNKFSATDSNFGKRGSSSQASMSTTAGRTSVFKSIEYPTLMESAKKNQNNLIKPISKSIFSDLKYSKTKNKNKLIPNHSNAPIIRLRGVKLEEKKSEKILPITITNPFKENRNNERPNTVPVPFFRQTQNLESEMSKSKIENIRKNEALYLSIDLSSNKNENLNNVALNKKNASLSVYTRPWSENIRQRKFSNLLGCSTNPLKVYEEQLEEVESIKKSFAKWGLACPVKNLENALITPWVNLENVKIAEPGIGLIANPFNKPEKKKKTRAAKSARK